MPEHNIAHTVTSRSRSIDVGAKREVARRGNEEGKIKEEKERERERGVRLLARAEEGKKKKKKRKRRKEKEWKRWQRAAIPWICRGEFREHGGPVWDLA